MQLDVLGSPAAFEEAGSGRPIVILHGMPADRRQMRLFFEPAFEDRPGWRRIYPDLPGMGETPGPGWLTEYDGFVDWAGAFVDATVGEGGRFSLAGSSFGGWVALRLVERLADRIDGLLLTAPAVHLGPQARRRPERRVLLPADDRLLAQVAADEQQWLHVAVVQTPETLDGFRRGTKLGVQAADHAFLDGLDPAIERAAPGGRLAAPFDRPTLILAGRQDHLAGFADAVDLLAAFPRATLAVLDRAGHGVPNEQRVLFRALVGEWLDRVEESSPA